MNIFENFVLTDIIDAVSLIHPYGNTNTMDNRKSYGISFCKEGQLTYTHNNKQFVSNSSNIIILPQGGSYSLKCDKSGEFHLINFTCDKPLVDTFVTFPIHNYEFLYNDFRQIKELLLFPENRLKAMSILYNIIHNLISHSGPNKTILPAIKYIENNYHNTNLTNEILAKECNISEVYLRNLFNKHLETTPKQYISDIRLQKAKQLLAENTIKVAAIAEKCGFAGTNHFWRFFKCKTGTTPTEYARQNSIRKI